MTSHSSPTNYSYYTSDWRKWVPGTGQRLSEYTCSILYKGDDLCPESILWEYVFVWVSVFAVIYYVLGVFIVMTGRESTAKTNVLIDAGTNVVVAILLAAGGALYIFSAEAIHNIWGPFRELKREEKWAAGGCGLIQAILAFCIGMGACCMGGKIFKNSNNFQGPITIAAPYSTPGGVPVSYGNPAAPYGGGVAGGPVSYGAGAAPYPTAAPYDNAQIPNRFGALPRVQYGSPPPYGGSGASGYGEPAVQNGNQTPQYGFKTSDPFGMGKL